MKRLVVVTALMAEAVPVVDHFRMRKLAKQPEFHHYQADLEPGRWQLELLVCGMGAAPTRRAICGFLEQVGSSTGSRWLNLGIAGARDFEIGQLVWARTIGGRAVGVPAGIAVSDSAEVVSLAKPGLAYRPGVLFDMEAESCLDTLEENSLQFAPQHLFCAKVISDNPARGVQQINRQWVMETIRKQTKTLDSYIHNIISTIE